MAVAKFNWHSTNPNKAFQGKDPPANAAAMINFNATAAETERAYNALKNHGPVSAFKTEVWNDICAKIYDISDDWGVNQIYRKSTVWNPFIHTPNRAQWENYAKETWPELSQDEYWLEEWVNKMFNKYGPGKFRSWNYNVVYSQWLIPLGLTPFEVKKGQRLKGEYILKLVEYINHWIDLSPLSFGFYLKMLCNMKGNFIVLPSIPAWINPLDLLLLVHTHVDLDDSIQAVINLYIQLVMKKLNIAELEACPLSSLMNFMKLNIECTIWDKIPIYTNFVLAMLYAASVTFALLPPVYLQINQQSTFNTSAKGDLSSSLDVLRVYLEMQLKQKVLADMANAYGFAFSSHQGNYRGNATLRTKRGLSFSIRDSFILNSRVLVEHQGTLLLFMKDGNISFVDNNSLVVHDAVQGTHSGNIGVSNEVELGGNASAALIPEDGNIIYHADTFDGLSAKAIKPEHKSSFGLESDQEFDQSVAAPMNLSDKIKGMVGEAEMSFANEQNITMRNGSFKIKDGDIQLDFQGTAVMDLNDTYDTAENIILDDAPPLEIGEADNIIRTVETASIERNAAIEAAAESIIKTLQSGEVSFGLNANLEAEVVAAKITSMATMEANRQCILDADISVSTIESAIADKIIRKLMEGTVSVETKVRASMILSLIHFIESTSNTITANSTSEVRTCLPKKINGKTQYINSKSDAFLDASYARGDGLSTDTRITVVTDVSPSIISSSAYLAALAIVEIMYDTQLAMAPTKYFEGNAVASSSSEASAVLARSTQILASELEDTLVVDKDSILASDFERKLIFN